MSKKIVAGEIVASQTAKLPSSDKEYGFITVQTPEKNNVKLKVDMATNYETIERGQRVVVEYDQLGGTDILSAKKITKE
ncbi:hypothetical protein EU546_03690 [Candidatus Thorarchaeota archaeon]|jgi:hypothetical protein|nr:MAG: hypothetical protein EU546_03690 [Candidatus Thorarchaeota archaeon]